MACDIVGDGPSQDITLIGVASQTIETIHHMTHLLLIARPSVLKSVFVVGTLRTQASMLEKLLGNLKESRHDFLRML